jgi:hydroxycarboxylate dehydrogenase B
VRTFSPHDLHRFVQGVAISAGSEAREATLVAVQLVGANLAGHDSHGVGMLPLYIENVLAGRLVVNQQPTTVRDSGAIVVLDGGRGFGAAMGQVAIDTVIERVAEHGLVMVGLRNSFHLGRIGHWGEQVAAAGYVAIHFVNVAGHQPIVAPYGGGEGRFVTNPICVAVPGVGDEPMVMLDMATSVIALGKARVAFSEGKPVPDGVLLDREGRVTTDPSGLFEDPRQGALVAMGDHKGSGLAMMCELLGAALIGGPTVQPGNERDDSVLNNMLTIAIDPDAVDDSEQFRREAEAFLEYTVTARPREGFREVLLPGQPEQRSRIARAATIPVDDNTVAQLVDAAASVGAPELGAALMT